MIKYALIIMLGATLFSCGTSAESSTSQGYPIRMSESKTRNVDHYLAETNFDTDKLESEMDLSQDDQAQNRLIIYNASLKLVVKKVDSLQQYFERIAKFHGGYVQYYNEERATIKVKNDRLFAAISAIEKLGEVTSKSIRAQDITTVYHDLEIALDNTRKARLRYLELLEKAQNVNEMLQVERELERINQTIDRLSGQLQNYDNSIQFSEISVQIHQKVKPGVLGYMGIGLWKGFRWLFVR